MNRAGFTTVEVMIASVLIIALVTAGAAGIRQMNLISQFASTRTAHTEVRTRVLGALNDSGTCALNLGNLVVSNMTVPTTIPQIKDGAIPILEDGKAAPGVPFDGLIYHLSLKFPTPTLGDSFQSGLGRSTARTRYSARLEIRGERQNLNQQAGVPLSDLFGEIPLSVEMDASNHVAYCTVHASDMDETLGAGSTHTVRECMQNDGFPIMTDSGLICRIPVPFQPQTLPGYPGSPPSVAPLGIPTCASLTPYNGMGGAWAPVIVGGIPYNSTLPIHAGNLPVCSGSNSVDTGWHSMSPLGVEATPKSVKKNASNTVSMLLGGAAIAATIGEAIFPGLGLAIATTLATLAFIFSLFHKCKSKTVTFYAQVNAIGCK